MQFLLFDCTRANFIFNTKCVTFNIFCKKVKLYEFIYKNYFIKNKKSSMFQNRLLKSIVTLKSSISSVLHKML